MRNLLEFLARYNHWLLFVLLEVIGVVLLFQYNSYQGSVWFSSANAVAGKVLSWDAKVESFFSMSKANQELTQRNLYLEQQVKMLSGQLGEATKDSGWVHRNQLSLLRSFKLIPAKVVSNSVDRYDNLLTIDKGSADGVRKDMGVACGQGSWASSIWFPPIIRSSFPFSTPRRTLVAASEAVVISVISIGMGATLVWPILRMFLVTPISVFTNGWRPVATRRFSTGHCCGQDSPCLQLA